VRVRSAVPDPADIEAAARVLRDCKRPLVIAGGGVLYSETGVAALRRFVETHHVPVAETQAGKSALQWDHPLQSGAIGVTGAPSANKLASGADAVVAVGTRLQDFTTGSHSLFPQARLVTVNVNAFDAGKMRATGVLGDAGVALDALSAALSGWTADLDWSGNAAAESDAWRNAVTAIVGPRDSAPGTLPYDGDVIGAVQRSHESSPAHDIVVCAAGSLPGELHKLWRASAPGGYHVEYGFSCMGYEISGAWGAKMARPADEVITFVGDGSYMMMNSDLYSSVLSGHKLIVIVCDNGGFAVINRLQINQGGEPFNNQIENTRHHELVYVDFAAHAAAMGCNSERAATVHELESALGRARHSDRTTVIALQTDAYAWTGGGAFWEVGVPEVSDRPQVQAAKAAMVSGLQQQRIGT